MIAQNLTKIIKNKYFFIKFHSISIFTTKSDMRTNYLLHYLKLLCPLLWTFNSHYYGY